ncbi:MAG: discoidin domain-containing protein [Verrucomicrobiota bacterium]
MKQPSDKIDPLVWKYLDDSITDQEFQELQDILGTDAELRSRFQLLIDVHHGLEIRANSGSAQIDFLEKGKASKIRSVPIRAWFGIAASVLLLLALGLALRGDPELEVHLTAARDADWRGAELNLGEPATTRILSLMQGAIALDFPGKTQVIIEGPAVFQIQDNQTIEMSSGTITVHHQGKPGTFHVLTPAGRFTDLGTKFGVTVGNGVTDTIVMTEVYEGEVVFDNDRDTSISLTDGDSYAIIGNNSHQAMHPELNGEKVRVNGTFELSGESQVLRSKENLALGKPVDAESYYNVPDNGEVFPPSALTDNRFYDTGSPWNWSFWLAPNGRAGQFTLDLLGVYPISRIDLMNTRNRHFNDRGIDRFIIEVSTDGENFELLFEGVLQPIEYHDQKFFDFESFEFDSVDARYVRFTGKSHFSRKGPHPSPGGGGLNEIRVFE